MLRKMAALQYLKHGYSVIPVKDNKRPYFAWEKYQHEKATEDDVNAWWDKWPKANIAVVTGAISGIDVIDADSKAGEAAIEEFCPDSIIIPRSKTPKGDSHSFFRHRPGLNNGVRVLTDTDLRTNGGYVLVPPSSNGKGVSYAWVDGLSIFKTPIPDMPDPLFDILSLAQTDKYNNSSNIVHSSTRENSGHMYGAAEGGVHSCPPVSTNVHQMFEHGRRDNDLFHTAWCLKKGGMPDEEIYKVLEHLIISWGEKPDPKWIRAKVQSASKRDEKKNTNLSQEIRETILSTNGYFLSTNVYNCLSLSTRKEKKLCSKILGELVASGEIERDKTTSGKFRRVEAGAQPLDWKSAKENWVKLYLPWDLDRFIKIPEGGLILLMGNPNSGKSAALINIARYNMRKKWNVKYLSTEISEGNFKSRAEAYKDLKLSDWNVNFYYDPPIVDTIQPGAGNLWLIDYIELYDQFWSVGKILSDIHRKLQGGVAICAIQKQPGSSVGLGGQFTQFKPNLALALEWQKVKIVKAKDFDESHLENYGNPNGKEYHFKMVDNRTKYIKERWWSHPFQQQGG